MYDHGPGYVVREVILGSASFSPSTCYITADEALTLGGPVPPDVPINAIAIVEAYQLIRTPVRIEPWTWFTIEG